MTNHLRIHADHDSVRHLGHWTEAGSFEVRGRGGAIVLDLRSPRLPKEVDIELRLDRAMVRLLLPDEAVVEHWDLEWSGRGKIKDSRRAGAAPRNEMPGNEMPRNEIRSEIETTGRIEGGDGIEGGREIEGGPIRVRLRGSAHHSEIRVNRGGVAQLAAMCSRQFFKDALRAHKTGTLPTVDDPTRTAMAAMR